MPKIIDLDVNKSNIKKRYLKNYHIIHNKPALPHDVTAQRLGLVDG